MNMNNRLWTTLYEMDIRIHTVDVSHEAADEVTYHENYLKQILPTVFFYQKFIHLDENSFILCSLMTKRKHFLSNRTKLGSYKLCVFGRKLIKYEVCP